MRVSKLAKVAALAIAFGLVASTPAYAVNLQGSGASFPANLIEACKAPFAAATGHSFTYQSAGSSLGRGNSDKSIGDFWMTDGAHIGSSRRSSIIHVPLVAAPIAIMHNLPGKKTLQLRAETVAKIFGGQITMWNDPQIFADNNRTVPRITYSTNPDGTLKKDAKGDPIVLRTRMVKSNYILPNKRIQVVVRSDGSGTSENFTNYLHNSARNVWPKPRASVFRDSFPGDINAPGNLGRIVGASSSTGVGLQASRTPYSITYNEVNYAKTYKLKVANLINPAGSAVAPDGIGTSAFLASATQDSNGFLTFDYDTKEKGAYPLGIVSYLLADTNYPSAATGRAVKQLAEFILSPECALDAGEDLGFALITGDFLKKSLAQVAKIK